MRWRSAVSGLLLAALAGLAPAGPAARAHAAAAPVLRIDWGAEPADLNPVTAVDEVSFNVLNAVMEGLTRSGPGGRVEPGIARAWTVSDGGRTYVFHLRDARWSNGDPVTARDFVYAWDQALNPCNASQYAYQLQYIAGSAPLLSFTVPTAGCDAATLRQIAGLEAHLGIRAEGPHTLVVQLTAATPYWVGLTAFPTYFPLDQAPASRWGMSLYGQDVRHMVFDGPFVISSWVPGSHLDLVRNPRYWDARHVYLAGVHGVIVTDAQTMVNLFQTGGLDLITDIPSPFIKQFEHQSGYRTFPLATVVYLEMSVRQAPFDQRLVRLAFSEAVDRASLAADVVQAAEPAYAFTPPVIPYAPGKPFTALVGHLLDVHAQPARAKADLAQGLKALHLKSLPPVTLLTVSGSDSGLFSQALQATWEKTLGVTVRIESVDLPTYVHLLQGGQFSIALAGWGADYNDPTTFLDLWTANGPFNSIGWSSAAYDRYLAKAAAATGARARGEDLAGAERVLMAQLPVAPLYWPERAWIAQPDVHGLVWNLTGPDFSLKGVRIS